MRRVRPSHLLFFLIAAMLLALPASALASVPDPTADIPLTQGESAQSIGDYVWHDLNADGIQDLDEPGIPGVTVRLLDSGGNLLQTTVTDVTGYYLFDVFPGDYIVEFVRPAGYLPSPQDQGGDDLLDSDADPVTGRTIVTTISLGEEDWSWDAGFYLPARIGNYVWVDENNDGYQDAGEPGIPNVRVVLFNSAGGVVATTFTDAHGGYLFDNLAPGNYFVRVDGVTIPFGMTQTPIYPNPGADFFNQDQTTGVNDYGYPASVAAGGENLTADFGYNYPPGAIGDHVWVDADGDGVQDPEEAGIPGVCLELFGPGPDGIFDPGADGRYGTGDDDSTVLATQNTNATGYYIFSNLAAGGYVVQVCANNFTPGGPLSGFTQTGDPDHFGLPGGINDNMTTTPVVLAPGDVFLNADFGYQPPANQCGDIGDLVWLDVNGNGAATPDAGEPGIAGVTVALIRDTNGNGFWESGEPIIATDTTDANGAYLFRCLPVIDGQGTDDYLVWVNDTNNVLAGLTQTYDSNGIVATPNVSAATDLTPADDLLQDFSYTPVGQEPNEGVIGDTIWLNIDGDNTQDPGEPGIEGVLMNLYSAGSDGQCGTGDDVLSGTTTTDENGHYYFGGLPVSAGGVTYCVVVDPANFNPGGPLAGLANTYDPDGVPLNQSTVILTTANPINLAQDFGYTPPTGQAGTIGDLVWNDVNADGDVDAGENGIAGVTIDLIRDLNGNGDIDPGEPIIGTTVTGAGGAYLFTGLPTSDGTPDGDVDYIVNVTDVAGVLAGYWHSLGTPDTNNNSQVDPYPVALTTAAPDVLYADFGYYVLPAALGNFVWNDANGNGLQDAGEPGIDGVEVTLVASYFGGATTTMVTTTGDDPTTAGTQQGWYGFGNLLLDEDQSSSTTGTPTPTQPVYTISVATPSGYVVTLLNQGGDDMIDADDPAGVDGITFQGSTNVSQNTASPGSESNPNAGYDFGYESVQSIGDYVWHDLNANGIQETGEPGIPGVTVRLLDGITNSILDTTVTDVNGYYLFDVIPGSYRIEFVRPAGFLPSPQDQGGDDTIDSDADPSSGRTIPTTISLGEEDWTWDAGFYLPARIGNYVWVDENNDGYQDAGEAGIPNVRVVLYNSAGAVVDDTFTDAHGGYLFDNLVPGNYFVQVDGATIPFGMTQTPIYPNPGADFFNQDQTTGVNDYGYPASVAAGGENLTADFGYNYPLGSIGDHVWLDADGDGVQDPEEAGIPGVCLELFGPGPDGLFNPGPDNRYGTGDDDSTVLATQNTNATGYYIFSNLAAGGYVVQVCQSSLTGPLAGYTQTGDPDHFGLPGGVNDNLTTTPVVLAPGDVFLNADFGYQPPVNQCGNIGDLVWLDVNGNGASTPDAGEPGIAGVTVALIRDSDGDGLWDAGEPVIATDTTNANGNYLFPCLPVTDGQGTDDYLVWVNDTNNVLAGLTQTYDSNGLATPNVSAATNLAPAGNLLQDFSYTPVGQEPNEGVIGDTIWLNIDGDNTQDPGEPGIEGVLMNLYEPGPNGVCGGGDDVLIGTTYTDENGHYYFGGLPVSAGGVTYCVVVDPANFNPGGPLAGLANTYDPDGAPLNQSTVILTTANPINLAQDFGYTPPTGQAGTIGDLVWNDVNADGNVDAGENGIAGVTIDLIRDLNGNGDIDPGEPIIGTTVTGAGGAYLFTGLPTNDGSGDNDVDYVVNVTDVAGVLAGYWHSLGLPDTNNNSQVDPYAVALTVAQPNVLYADFGYYVVPAALGNKVWFDPNGNGLQDPGDPGIANVRVRLTITYPDATVTILETLTDNTGYYAFGNLLLDEDHNGSGANEPVLIISVTNPPFMVPTVIDVNANGNDNQDADNPAGVTAAVTEGQNDVSPQAPVTSETPNAWYDFGYIVNDYGDLPDTAPGVGVGNYQTLLVDNGASFLVWDTTPADRTPNLGGAIWMGEFIDGEPDGQPTAAADGDDLNGIPDDEDGVGSTWAWPTGGVGTVIITVNKLDAIGNPLPTGTLTGAVLAFWIDWNNNGVLTDAGEINIWGDSPGEPVVVGPNTINVAVPPNFTTPQTLYMRFRVYDGPQGVYLPSGSLINGEVEDYLQPVRPVAVVLEEFYAEVQNNQVRVVWVTVSEIQNLGFNLYRGTSRNPNEAIQLNSTMIPSAAPGSASGHEYEWIDTTATPGHMYYYWLEDVENTGIVTRHGPESVVFGTARLGFLPWLRK